MADAYSADCNAAELDRGIVVQRHAAADPRRAILAPSGNQNSAHGFARLVWAAVVALVVNDDRLFGAVSALDCGHGDRDAGADDVIGVELVALGENRIPQVGNVAETWLISQFQFRLVQ